MGLLSLIPGVGSAVSAVAGLISDKNKNKRSKQELDTQRALASRQIDISKYIEDLSRELMSKGTTQVDPYGGTTGYDPATGAYRSTLGPAQQRTQAASDAEEAARLTIDQELRRAGLASSEGLRSDAARASGAALGDIDNFRRGIGRVDPNELASRIRLDRTAAVNAGYDDAERAAQTIQTRTGSSAVADALRRLATDRVRAQAQIGSPEVEGLQLADTLNQGRSTQLGNFYNMFTNEGRDFHDAPFTPAPYAAAADAKIADNMRFDLGKYEVAQGGSGTAAAGIGSAAAGLRQGYQLSEANRVAAPTARFMAGLTDLFGQMKGRI